ncbi:hypothetical protein KDA14_04830 [Candidatus Saccharibacteria bacterium]|nr:hypothetical protein [Candidatus Saccharibacteria bacterium]
MVSPLQYVAAFTVTVAVLLLPVPPAFEQLIVNVYEPAPDSVTTCEPPLVDLLPLQPVPPAVQDVGLLPVDQLTVVELPALIVLGDTETLTVGTAMTVSVAEAEPDPIALLQVSV